jgi:hypothetical protein
LGVVKHKKKGCADLHSLGSKTKIGEDILRALKVVIRLLPSSPNGSLAKICFVGRQFAHVPRKDKNIIVRKSLETLHPVPSDVFGLMSDWLDADFPYAPAEIFYPDSA